MTLTDEELLSAASPLYLSRAESASQEEREAAAYLTRLRAQHRERAEVEAFVLARVERHQAERARMEAEAQRDREDPLTLLPLALEPASADDCVFLSHAGGIQLTEFRRPDGRRYRYQAPELREGDTLTVACLPRADCGPEQIARSVGTGADYDDLLGMCGRWQVRWQAERRAAKASSNPFWRPPHDEPRPLDIASAMVRQHSDCMAPVIARWGRYALANQADDRGALAGVIRKHLAQIGRLELMIPFTELERMGH